MSELTCYPQHQACRGCKAEQGPLSHKYKMLEFMCRTRNSLKTQQNHSIVREYIANKRSAVSYSVTAASTAASQQEGSFKRQPRPFCVGSLGTPAYSHSSKVCMLASTVGFVTDWQPVQDASCLLPYDSCDGLHFLCNLELDNHVHTYPLTMI